MIHDSLPTPTVDSQFAQALGGPTQKPANKLATLGSAALLAAASAFALVSSAGASCVSAPPTLAAWWKLDTVNFGVSTPEIVASNHAALYGNPLTNVQGQVGQSFYFGSAHLTANLDEIQIYKRALSLAEIQAIRSAGPDGVCPAGVPLLQTCGAGGSS